MNTAIRASSSSNALTVGRAAFLPLSAIPVGKATTEPPRSTASVLSADARVHGHRTDDGHQHRLWSRVRGEIPAGCWKSRIGGVPQGRLR
jgi:hypothetical protein